MIRLATIGTSAITERFVDAVSRLGEQHGIRVDAVYSRDLARGRAFAERLGIGSATDDLAALGELVDAVYIGSPNGAHLAQARAAIEAGLHVFLEKPATPTAPEFAELVEAAKARGVVVFEGMRNVHDPGVARVRELLPLVGTLRRASLSLCQRSARYDLVLQGDIPNIFDPALAGGALLDLGVYPLAAAVELFGEPDRVVAAATVILTTGVDGAGTAVLGYPGAVVDIGFSKITGSTRPSEIQGERGTLMIDRITEPRTITFVALDGRVEVHPVDGDENNMTYEIARFAHVINSGGAGAEVDQERTLAVLRTADAVRRVSVAIPA